VNAASTRSPAHELRGNPESAPVDLRIRGDLHPERGAVLHRAARAGRARSLQSGRFRASGNHHDHNPRHHTAHDCNPAEQHDGRAGIDDHAPRRVANDPTRGNHDAGTDVHDATVIHDNYLDNGTHADVDHDAYPLKAVTGRGSRCLSGELLALEGG
jgi:hypothetical protein